MAATLTAAVLVTTVSPASAERDRSRDARRDVVQATFLADGQTVAVNRPDNAAQDIVAITVRYGGGRVRLALTVRDLPRRKLGVVWYVRTPVRTWAVGFVHNADHRRTFFEDSRGGVDDRARPCRRLRARQLNAADRVVLTFPRACIGPQRWIRTGAWTWRPPVPNDTAVMDDARLRSGPPNYGPKLGRRLHYN